MRKTLIIVITTIAIIFGLSLWYMIGQNGSLIINSSPTNIRLVLDEKDLSYPAGQAISLKAGHHTLVASLAEYQTSKYDVVVTKNQRTNIDINLKPNFDSSIYKAAGTQTGTIALVGGKDFQINNIHYFENNQWAVASFIPLNPPGDGGLIVLQQKAGAWTNFTSGSYFQDSDLADMPSSVADYIRSLQ